MFTETLEIFASKITCTINGNSPNRVLLVSVGFKVAAETFSKPSKPYL